MPQETHEGLTTQEKESSAKTNRERDRGEVPDDAGCYVAPKHLGSLFLSFRRSGCKVRYSMNSETLTGHGTRRGGHTAGQAARRSENPSTRSCNTG
jgi:hypothetical protein